MEILFSNGSDKLQIKLPEQEFAADGWFEAPMALQVGGLKFCLTGPENFTPVNTMTSRKNSKHLWQSF